MSLSQGRSGHAPSAARTWFVRGALMLGILAAIGLVYLLIHGFLANADKPKRLAIQQIAILRPPPPPPPPKEEEKPPPPEIKKEEVKLPEPDKPDEPKPADNQPAPSQNLGLDAEGAAGSDAFGLVGNKGGRDITTIGSTGGDNHFGHFISVLQQELQRFLARDDKLRKLDYRVVVKIWLSPEGVIQRYELVDSSGNAQTDAQLKSALGGVRQIAEGPPADMPQPVRVRVTSRL